MDPIAAAPGAEYAACKVLVCISTPQGLLRCLQGPVGRTSSTADRQMSAVVMPQVACDSRSVRTRVVLLQLG